MYFGKDRRFYKRIDVAVNCNIYTDTDEITGAQKYTIQIVAFISSVNPYWLNNGYSCSKKEFTECLNNGSACNLTMISETKKYNWSWLSGFVANIEDVIKDNAEVSVCQ